MKYLFVLISSVIINQFAFSQCTIYDASDCQCLDPTQTDCDLLPDIQLSWFALEDVSDGPTEYAQTGNEENNGRLRISASTPNSGHGPLTVRGAGPDGNRTFICGTDTTMIYDPNSIQEFYCPDGSDPDQIIWQRIYHKNSDGSMSHYDRAAGTMTYHPDHGHNHTNDWGVFTLRKKVDNILDPRDWPIVSDGAKLGFCLMDYGICNPNPNLDLYSDTDYTGHCRDINTIYGEGEVLYNVDFPNFGLGGGAYGCSEVEQGISSGYLDLYGEWLDEQWINLDANLCNGEYWIVGEADPNDYYIEENEDNNYTAIPVTLVYQGSNSESTINLQGNVEICDGETIELSANYGDSYLWNTGETSQTISVTQAGNYSVNVSNSNCEITTLSSETTVNTIIVDTPSLVESISESCLNQELSLELNCDNANWYNTDNILVFSGNPYYIPLLEDDIHLFASQISSNMGSNNVGQESHLGSNSYSGSEYNSYQIFNANSDFILKSIDVFTDNQYSGERLIELRGSNNAIILDTLVFISGDATIDLNWEIAEGLNYRLGTNDQVNESNFGYVNPMLKRSNQGTNYPYEISNVVSITDSEYGNEYYYYFYNWDVSWIQSSCESDELIEIIIEAKECEVSIDELIGSSQQIIAIYDLSGKKVENSLEFLTTGVYIAKYDNRSVKFVIN
jgi:hypothetical protein